MIGSMRRYIQTWSCRQGWTPSRHGWTLARLCAAWDFGRLPSPETVAEVRRSDWRKAVDACRLLTSPVYHLLRRWHNLPPLPYLGAQLPYIRDDPNLAFV